MLQWCGNDLHCSYPLLCSLLITSEGHVKLTDFGLSKIGLVNCKSVLDNNNIMLSILRDHNIIPSLLRAAVDTFCFSREARVYNNYTRYTQCAQKCLARQNGKN